MDPLQYLRALRRRWPIVLLTVAVAIMGATLTNRVAPAGPPTRGWKATAVIMSSSTQIPKNYLKRLTAFITVGKVPERVAQVLKSREDPKALAAKIQTSADEIKGVIHVTSTTQEQKEAAPLANTFATEFLAYLRDRSASAAAARVEVTSHTLDTLKREIADLDLRIAGTEGTEKELLRAERDAKIRRYGSVAQSYQDASGSTGGDTANLEVVEQATPYPVLVEGIRPPTTGRSRSLLAAGLGLLAGVALALLIERVDTRIRTKEVAEKYFGAPVLTEIPRLPRGSRRRFALVAATHPLSGVSDSFRMLEAGIALGPASPFDDAETNGRQKSDPQVILVTSPGPSEGKSWIAANLAIVMAERKKSVIVLSCDFRRPRIHQLFKVSNSRGLSQALFASTPDGDRGQWSSVLDNYLTPTRVPGVQIIPSGPTPLNPAGLLTSDGMRALLAEARRRADVIILDTPPLLISSDASHLLTQADSVVVVGYAGKTTFEHAGRASELLKRLGAKLAGVALNGVPKNSQSGSFMYRGRYYRRPLKKAPPMKKKRPAPAHAARPKR
jgi:capsular exopolysaccharide synthesis family protein